MIKLKQESSKDIKSEKSRSLSNKVKVNKYTITGGSFGLHGKLIVSGDTFTVDSTKKISFERSHVQDIILSKGGKEKKFSILKFILGFIVTLIITFFVAIATLGLLTMVAFIIGMVITIVGSFYSKKEKDTGSIILKDGKKIEVTGKLDQLLAST